MILVDNFFREAHVLPVHQRITFLCTLIHTVIDTHSQERGHCLGGIISLGKLRRTPIETSSEVPMLIVLKGEYIEQQLEIVHCRFAQHIHMILNFITRKAFHHLLHLIEGTLHRVAISIILMSRFAANRHIELHLRGKTWHEVVTSSQLEILTEGRRGDRPLF